MKDLLPVNINELVLATGYFEVEIGGVPLSLAPERHPNGRYYVTLFVNHLRQPKTWELSARPHNGHLRQGGYVPYANDETYYVIGTDGKRYRHLFIDPEHCRIGVRTDFFPHHWQAYPRRQNEKSLHDQAKALEKELFETTDEFTREYEKRLKLSRFGM